MMLYGAEWLTMGDKNKSFWGQTKFNLDILIKKVEALKKELGRRNKGYRTHVPGQHTQLNSKSRLPTAKKLLPRHTIWIILW